MSRLTPAPTMRVHDGSGVAAHGEALASAGQSAFRSERVGICFAAHPMAIALRRRAPDAPAIRHLTQEAPRAKAGLGCLRRELLQATGVKFAAPPVTQVLCYRIAAPLRRRKGASAATHAEASLRRANRAASAVSLDRNQRHRSGPHRMRDRCDDQRQREQPEQG
jgi:hypothetical protein